MVVGHVHQVDARPGECLGVGRRGLEGVTGAPEPPPHLEGRRGVGALEVGDHQVRPSSSAGRWPNRARPRSGARPYLEPGVVSPTQPMVMTVGDGDGVGVPDEGLVDGDGRTVGEPDARREPATRAAVGSGAATPGERPPTGRGHDHEHRDDAREQRRRRRPVRGRLSGPGGETSPSMDREFWQTSGTSLRDPQRLASALDRLTLREQGPAHQAQFKESAFSPFTSRRDAAPATRRQRPTASRAAPLRPVRATPGAPVFVEHRGVEQPVAQVERATDGFDDSGPQAIPSGDRGRCRGRGRRERRGRRCRTHSAGAPAWTRPQNCPRLAGVLGGGAQPGAEPGDDGAQRKARARPPRLEEARRDERDRGREGA